MNKDELLALAERARDARSVYCDCPLHTLRKQRIDELVEPTLDDLKAACDLIGNDTYGKPHWTPETIHPHNSVVQKFARHALRALAERSG